MKRPGLKSIVARLKKYNPLKIILFGSHSTGAADKYSDIDLIIIKDTPRRFLDRIAEVFSILKPTYAFDVLVYTPAEFEVMKKKDNPFIRMVVNTGKLIYEKK